MAPIGEDADDFLGLAETIAHHDRLAARAESGLDLFQEFFDDELPWRLLGIHSSRMDMGDRDPVVDESLGLNISWYPDILLTLTEPAPAPAPARA